jgi:hypothetical protein
VYTDPTGIGPYSLHFFEISIRGKNTRGEDVPLFGEIVAVREENGQFEIVPSDVILNLPPHPTPAPSLEGADPAPAADFLKGTYQLECRARCQHEREQFAAICRDYLVKSFKARIDKAQERAMLLGAQASTSSDYQRAYEEACKVVDDLERTRTERLAGLDRLALARTGPVRHVATALVLPPDATIEAQLEGFALETDAALRRKKELRAEEITIEALVREGFPRMGIERVGSQKIGFDIRAHRVIDEQTGQIEVRRIEVKGYTRGSPIQLTVNEWYKAQQLAETYWLYVVWDPLSNPTGPVCIQNPALKLDHAKREVAAARFFLIPAEAIDNHA